MIPLRLARELTHQLEHASRYERLARVLSNVPIFITMFHGDGSSRMLELWQKLAERGLEPESHFKSSFEGLRNSTSRYFPDGLLAVQKFFEFRGDYPIVAELLTELLWWTEEHHDQTRAMRAHLGIGALMIRTGDIDSAMMHLGETIRIAQLLGEKIAMAAAIINTGVLHKEQGRYPEALECYQRGVVIAESIGHTVWIRNATNNMGVVYMIQGRYAEAMKCYEKQIAISELLGDKNNAATGIGNMGIVYQDQGYLDQAMQCYEKQLGIAEALGDKAGVSMVVSNIANVLQQQGRYADAMERFLLGLTIAESIGRKAWVLKSIGNIGFIHQIQGRFATAMECFVRQLEMTISLGDKSEMAVAHARMGKVFYAAAQYYEAEEKYRKALEISRAIGDRPNLVIELEGISNALIAIAEQDAASENTRSLLREARENSSECIRISEVIGRQTTFFSGRVVLARIDAAEGNIPLANKQLEAMLAEATDEEQIADLHYWLWKISEMDSNHQEALTRYSVLYERIPKFEFVKRIAELKGERIPMSADDLENAAVTNNSEPVLPKEDR